MSDPVLASWLEEAQLGKYLTKFEEAGITAGSLLRLTLQDYSPLGVVEMADRKRLFQLIQQLKATHESSVPSPVPAPAPVVQQPAIVPAVPAAAPPRRLASRSGPSDAPPSRLPVPAEQPSSRAPAPQVEVPVVPAPRSRPLPQPVEEPDVALDARFRAPAPLVRPSQAAAAAAPAPQVPLVPAVPSAAAAAGVLPPSIAAALASRIRVVVRKRPLSKKVCVAVRPCVCVVVMTLCVLDHPSDAANISCFISVLIFLGCASLYHYSCLCAGAWPWRGGRVVLRLARHSHRA